MKKLLAILLAGVMSATALSFNVSAAETNEKTDAEIQREKLGWLVKAYDNSWVGVPSIFDGYWPSVMENAEKVYETDGLTEYEYTVALRQMYDMYYDAPLINANYAEATYKNALKEQNYNNWYSEEQWNDFQDKLKKLGEALDYYHTNGDLIPCSRLTKAYKAMMTSYNKMTNAYKVKGDINRDGSFDIQDATLVQKYVAKTANLTGAQKMLTNEKNYENITVVTATNLQKHIVDSKTDFENNYIFIDEMPHVSSLDDTLRWYNYCNFNICPRRNDVTYGSYVENNFTCMDKVFGYRIWCDEKGYDYT